MITSIKYLKSNHVLLINSLQEHAIFHHIIVLMTPYVFHILLKDLQFFLFFDNQNSHGRETYHLLKIRHFTLNLFRFYKFCTLFDFFATELV